MPFRSKILRDLVVIGDQLKDPNLLVDVIQIFIEQAPLQCDELAKALAVGDFKTVLFQAHKLKTSSGVVGADHLQEICQEIENNINESARLENNLYEGLRQEVALECLRIKDELASFTKSRTPHLP